MRMDSGDRTTAEIALERTKSPSTQPSDLGSCRGASCFILWSLWGCSTCLLWSLATDHHFE